MEYRAFEEIYNNPVSEMFRTDKIRLEKMNSENPETAAPKAGLILEIGYNWTHQMNLSMFVQKSRPFEYHLEPMGISDYQTATANLHEIMELYPDCISEQQETVLLEKWATYFRGLENAVFIHSTGKYFPADCEICEKCKDRSEPLIIEFDFSYFPSVPNSRLGKESLSVIHYVKCIKCGFPSGNEVSGEFQSFAYDALEMIEDIIAENRFIYTDHTPLKEAAEFIRAKINS